MKGVSASLVTAACCLVLVTEPVSGLACTADAKICPDGSYVGREGPNCDFAACPSSSSSGSGSRGVFCSADAKVCPDGSYVGREGPNCEFKSCNGTTTTGGSKSNEVQTPISSPVPSPSSPTPTQSAASTVVGSIVSIACVAVAVVLAMKLSMLMLLTLCGASFLMTTLACYEDLRVCDDQTTRTRDPDTCIFQPPCPEDTKAEHVAKEEDYNDDKQVTKAEDYNTFSFRNVVP